MQSGGYILLVVNKTVLIVNIHLSRLHKNSKTKAKN